MKKQDFNEFLKRVDQQKKETQAIDWEKKKNEWLAYLNKLYEKFNLYLEEYIAEGIITINYQNVSITEEYIGSYTAPEMIINLGNEQVILTPVGTNLIGAKGRVDIAGRLGSAQLVLIDANTRNVNDPLRKPESENQEPTNESEEKKALPKTWEWKFVSAPPTRKFQPVNEETIYSVIMEVTNG
ncbi:hypothetical protein JHL22_15405 [Advenella sp. WQ 585]|uniref:Uncharacterized protein n=1 Tax=Advenella mandrilli TaxID=2800330 RepID=A0ABS1EHU5_9BURK|nr:hypothetical protein [Advenella mandrilli]MBK1782599.1 hypothetical protein [Advenella mandrilli]